MCCILLVLRFHSGRALQMHGMHVCVHATQYRAPTLVHSAGAAYFHYAMLFVARFTQHEPHAKPKNTLLHHMLQPLPVLGHQQPTTHHELDTCLRNVPQGAKQVFTSA